MNELKYRYTIDPIDFYESSSKASDVLFSLQAKTNNEYPIFSREDFLNLYLSAACQLESMLQDHWKSDIYYCALPGAEGCTCGNIFWKKQAHGGYVHIVSDIELLHLNEVNYHKGEK